LACPSAYAVPSIVQVVVRGGFIGVEGQAAARNKSGEIPTKTRLVIGPPWNVDAVGPRVFVAASVGNDGWLSPIQLT
jgi:hypothetical protein